MPAPKKTVKAQKKETAAKAETTRKKPKDALDQAVNLVSPTIDFIKDNFRDLFMKFLKVELVSTVIALGLLVLFGLITVIPLYFVSGGDFTSLAGSGWMMLSLLILWVIIALYIIGWVANSVSMTALIITKEQYERKYSGIMPLFNRIKFPVLFMTLVSSAIFLVFIILPAVVIYLVANNSSSLLILLGMVFIIYAFLFLILFRFFAQFWSWELLVREKGAIESLRSSFSLVMANILGVLVYDVIAFVAGIIIAIPLMVLYFIIEFAFRIGMVAAAASGGLLAIAIAVGIYIIFRFLFQLLATTISQTILLPYAYSFWNSLEKPNL